MNNIYYEAQYHGKYDNDIWYDIDTKYDSVDLENPNINYDVLRNFGIVKEKDTDNVLYRSSIEEICKRFIVYYNGDKKISLTNLINNYDLINFRFLLETTDNICFSEFFIKTFKLIEIYPDVLSKKLKFESHKSLIDEYKDDKRLNWKSIQKSNSPIPSEYLMEYYKYFRKVDTIAMENFTIDNIMQIVEIESGTDHESFGLLKASDLLKKIFAHNTYSEDDLIRLIKFLTKKRNFENEKEKGNFDLLVYTLQDCIFGKTQNYTEKVVLCNKNFSVKSESSKCHTSRHAKYSEEFVRENPQYINWKCLSQNPNVMYGTYSDEFYEEFSDKLDFDQIRLDEFAKNSSKDRFKKFLIKFNDNFSTDKIEAFLQCQGNIKFFDSAEMVKYFPNAIQRTITKTKSFKRICHFDEEYAIAVFKELQRYIKEGISITDFDYDLSDYLNDSYHRPSTKFIKAFKKEIFDIMLNKSYLLKTETVNIINSRLEKDKKGNE